MADHASLHQIASDLVAPGRGILAADESFPTIKKRFDAIGVDSTEANRCGWRSLLFSTAGAEQYISGVICFDETLRQSNADGVPLPRVLADAGIIAGIKVDKGARAMAGAPGEKVTEGLDGLRDRLSEYHELGARFAKWRAVITIGADGRPSTRNIAANAEALARYAALCQEAGLVPIVEPEVLMDGDHSLARCEAVTTDTLRAVFAALALHEVDLPGTLLKPNMVISGKGAAEQADAAAVAEATVRCFRNSVPAAVPGIVFLSGGQSEQQATANLNEMNKRYRSVIPWQLSFSYGRALQASPLRAWSGSDVAAGQAAFLHRSRLNGAARFGEYSSDME